MIQLFVLDEGEKWRFIRKFKKLFVDEFNFKAILQYKIQIILLKVRIENCYNDFKNKQKRIFFALVFLNSKFDKKNRINVGQNIRRKNTWIWKIYFDRFSMKWKKKKLYKFMGTE